MSSIEELVSLVDKAMTEHSHTKSLCIQVISENDTIKLMGRVNSYFLKSVVITVARKACPHKELMFNDVVVADNYSDRHNEFFCDSE